jgi:hypothetical protein
MSVAARLAGFALVLALCFAGAYGLGTMVGPLEDGSTPTTTTSVPPMSHGTEHGG